LGRDALFAIGRSCPELRCEVHQKDVHGGIFVLDLTLF